MWVGEYGFGRVRWVMLVGGRVLRVVSGVRCMNAGGRVWLEVGGVGSMIVCNRFSYR